MGAGTTISQLAAWRDRIDAIVDAARAALAEAYPEAEEARFPFAIHHSAMRVRIREPRTRRSFRHAEIADLVVRWASLNGGAETYAWQCVAVAAGELAAERPNRCATELAKAAAKALAGVTPFVDWAKAEAGPRDRAA